jgi:hypothetical protein
MHPILGKGVLFALHADYVVMHACKDLFKIFCLLDTLAI